MTSLGRQGPSLCAWTAVFLVAIISNALSTVAPGPALDGSGNTFIQDFSMPSVQPTHHDEYICTAKKVEPKEAFIVQYEVHSPNNKAHHILLFGCKGVDPQNVAKGHWGCGEGNICQNMKIMFAWAKNAPPTTLPPDVGFRIGGNSGVNYLVLEIHYAHPLNESDSSGIYLHTTYEPQNYIAGIFLLLAQESKIPPKQAVVHTDINCLYKSQTPIHPFAYRVHAHSLGVVISGYKYNTKQREWTLLGKGNPQWPQAFYPMEKVHKVDSTDILVARCTFNSSERDRWTYIGSTAADEMCNFYIMYYTDSQRGTPFGECVDAEYPGLVDMMPLDSDVPLPRNPLLEEHAHGSNPMQQHSKVTKRPLNNAQDSSLVSAAFGGREHEISPDLQSSVNDDFNGPVPYRGKVHHGNNNQVTEDNAANAATNTPQGKAFLGFSLPPLPNLYQDQISWPKLQGKLGQVTAVALDSNDNVWIFHRANRVWDESTFDVRNRYKQISLGPIQETTIIKLDQKVGNVLHEWGSDLFYMPHGLTIDKAGNIWVTDVALHQVMKFPSGGVSDKPLLILGTALEPGSDNSHFCKPASVAVAESGEFYVADGYCNSRILKYSPSGTLELQWGKSTTAILGFKVGVPPPYAFDIPHKVALAEDKGLVCVADRENGRIQCFSMNNGSFHCQINSPQFGGRLFAVAYTPSQGGLLYAVNGPTTYSSTSNVQGFVVNISSQKIIGSIRPQSQNLQFPHDIAVTSDGSAAFIAEIGPNKIWKFLPTSGRSGSAKQLPGVQAAEKPPAEQHSSTTTPPTTGGSPLPLHHTQVDNKEVFMSPLSNDSSSFALSMIIIAVLSIPILLMIIITVVIRLRKQGKFHSMNLGHVKGWMTGYKQPNSDRFNLGNFLHPHKGFDRVSMEESDAELDNSDSDVEEYSASVQKA